MGRYHLSSEKSGPQLFVGQFFLSYKLYLSLSLFMSIGGNM